MNEKMPGRIPSSIATFPSLNKTTRLSLGVISLTANARTTRVADWLPVFLPPVSVSIGMNDALKS